MLALCLAASSAFAPLSPAPRVVAPAARAAAPLMADRKFINFDEETIFEAREISVQRKP